MGNFIKKILAVLAKMTLARYKPRVVAITGSIGKTSAKEAITAVLKSSFSVRANEGNYNNEFGVPLTIIGEKSGNKNPLLWLLIFLRAVLKLIATNYPKILVLELGADRPGDIAYLVDLVGNIDVGALTDIGISHLEFFKNAEELAREKLSLIKKLPRSSAAVLNFDNPKIFEQKNQTKAEVFGYGFANQAHVLISDFQIIQSEGVWGSNFKLHHRGTVVPFFLPNNLGKPMAYAAAAAATVALRFNINLVAVSQALKNFKSPPGRLRLITGINQTWIIDDSYNASPDSTFAAIETLDRIATHSKIVAFGEMLELGRKTDSAHRSVAVKIFESKIDLVFLVGESAKIIEDELAKRNFAGKVFWFTKSNEAVGTIAESLSQFDTILVKGSQASRMEKIVKGIMDKPQEAPKLLVRQNKEWLNKP